MQKQQDEQLLAKLLAAYPQMKMEDKVALVIFAEASVEENPVKIPSLTLVVNRRVAGA